MLGMTYRFKDGPRDLSSTFVHIQYLRGIAAILVVYFHTSVYDADLAWNIDRSFGYGGVDIFFAISGFIMTVTNFERPLTPARFLLNRVMRIYPPYWFALTVAVALFLAVPSAFLKDKIDLPYVLFSYALLPFENASATSHGVPFLRIAWTLIFEMYFYVVFAVSLFLRHTPLTRFLVQAAFILAMIGLGAVVPASAPMGFLKNPLTLEFLFGCMAGLAVGARILQAPRLAYSVAFLLVFLPFFVVAGHGEHHIRALSFGIPAAGFVLCAALYERFHGVLFRSPFLFLIGDASYSIYLFHPFALTGVRVVSKHLPIDVSRPLVGALGIFAAVASSILLGLVAFRLFERPSVVFTKRLAERALGRSSHERRPPVEAV